jgi:cobalt-zinc-cadmium efflux system outer membrane protein
MKLLPTHLRVAYNYWIQLFLIAMIVATPRICMAEEALHEDEVNLNATLSLHDVFTHTVQHNPQQTVLNALQGEIKASNINAQSLLPGAPAIALRHQSDAVGSHRGEREWEAELEMPIWLSGQRNARLNYADNIQSTLDMGKESLELRVAGLVRDAIWDIKYNEQTALLYLASVDEAQKIEQDVSKRLKAGELAKTDLMFAQNETLKAKAVSLKAHAEWQHAKFRYVALTGLNEMPSQPEEPLSTIAEITRQHPFLKEMQSKMQIAEGERALAAIQSRDNPQLIVSTRGIRGGFDTTTNQSIGLKVRIPFENKGRSATAIAKAESSIANVMADNQQLLLDMNAILHEVEHNLTVTESELALVKQQSDIAQASYDLAKKAFSFGETDLVNLIRIKAQAFDAQRAVISTNIQLQWAIARYNQAVGVLP